MARDKKYLGGHTVLGPNGEWPTRWDDPPLTVTSPNDGGSDRPHNTEGLGKVLERSRREGKVETGSSLKYKVIRDGVVIREGTAVSTPFSKGSPNKKKSGAKGRVKNLRRRKQK